VISFLEKNQRMLLLVIAAILAIIMGMFVSVFADFAGRRPALLIAVPAALVVGLIFIISRKFLFSIILICRSALDPVLATTKVGAFSVGAGLNGLIILIASLAIIRTPQPALRYSSRLWLIVILTFFASVYFSPDKVNSFKLALNILCNAAIFTMAIVLVRSVSDYKKWILIIFASSIIPVLYSFIDIARGGFPNPHGFRISSTFSHPNILAFYLVLMISIGFYIWKSKLLIEKKWLVILPVYLLVMVVLLLLTKTRSAWLGLAAFFFIYACLYERRYLFVLIGAACVALLIPEIRDRITDLGQGNEMAANQALNSYAWRKELWTSGLNWMEKSHYLFGYGLGSFNYYSITFFPLAAGKSWDSHSVYVQLMFEVGAIGFLAYILMLIRLGRKIYEVWRRNSLVYFIALLLLVEYALFSYSDNMLFYLSYNWYFWFVMGMTYSLAHIETSEVAA
jgi:O-antigen ligase